MQQSATFFVTVPAAHKAGKAALARLFKSLRCVIVNKVAISAFGWDESERNRGQRVRFGEVDIIF